jgi:hypothetical protein
MRSLTQLSPLVPLENYKWNENVYTFSFCNEQFYELVLGRRPTRIVLGKRSEFAE